MLLRSRKPVCLAVNKCDSVGPTNPDVYEFYALGLGDPIEVSAVHGHGTGDLLDWCVAHFPAGDRAGGRGRGHQRCHRRQAECRQVQPAQPHSRARSASSSPTWPARRATPSTAILKTNSASTASSTPPACARKSKVDDAIEKYSNLRSIAAIERADVCLILIDANEGVTEQDTKIAGLAHEAGQGLHHRREQVGYWSKKRPTPWTR